MKYLLIFAGVAALAIMGSMSVGQPKPSPLSDAWELDAEFQPLQCIEVLIPGQGPQKFWFLRYTVTNNTKEDQIFVPEFTLYTDSGDLLRAQRNVPPMVYEKIKKTLNLPDMKDQTAMTGKLLQGEDNAKTGVAIFRDFDGIAGQVHVFVGGLSGETQEVELPVEVEVKQLSPKGEQETVMKKKVVLARTLDLTYSFPGNPKAKKFNQALTPKSKEWIMR